MNGYGKGKQFNQRKSLKSRVRINSIARGTPNQQDSHMHGAELIHWSPSTIGRLKCNIDTAFFEYGDWPVCVRNHEGALLEAKAILRRYCPPVREGEALALKRHYNECKKAQGSTEVHIETDCQQVFNSNLR